MSKEEQQQNYFELLPNEILINVLFRYFTGKQLLLVSRVCKRFHVCGNDNVLWKKVCVDTNLILETETTKSAGVYKELYVGHINNFFNPCRCLFCRFSLG